MLEEKNEIALLIDAENINVNYIGAIMKEVSNYGRLVISRFYGDIKNISQEWSQTAIGYAIKPMHQYNVASGKNAADMAMALDAMEIMYQKKVNIFFIVSSDSDFTPLSSKLREGGMYVVGVGKESQVSKAFKSSCNEFKYFEYIIENGDDANEPKEQEDPQENIEKIIKEIITSNGSNNKLLLSILGTILVNRFSDFDSRKYGAKQLSSLVKTIPDLSLLKENKVYYVELNKGQMDDNIGLTIHEIISKNQTKKMKYSKLITELKKAIPDFDYKDYGYTKFKKFIGSIDGIAANKDFAAIKRK